MFDDSALVLPSEGSEVEELSLGIILFPATSRTLDFRPSSEGGSNTKTISVHRTGTTTMHPYFQNARASYLARRVETSDTSLASEECQKAIQF